MRKKFETVVFTFLGILQETKKEALKIHTKVDNKNEFEVQGEIGKAYKDLNKNVDSKLQNSNYKIVWVKKKNVKKPFLDLNNELDKHRNNIKEVLLASNSTMIRSHNDLGYLCFFCKEQFINPADLKSHTLKQHLNDVNAPGFPKARDLKSFSVKLDITNLECKICHKPIDSLQDLFDHLINEHKINIFTDVKNHIVPFKFDTDVLQCAECSLEISTFKCLYEHMHKHLRNFVCDKCDAGFINRRSLGNHLDRHNVGEYPCKYCKKIFDTKSRKLAHELSVHVHSNLRNKCGYCNERFSNLNKKELHLETVHGAKAVAVKCQACDKMLADRDALRTHIKRHHLMEKRHECPECDMKFFCNSSLVLHMVKHSKIREYQCHVCYKRYGRKKTLREHLRIHANDRRYKCELCSMSFVQNCSLKAHLRSKHFEYLDP